MKSAPESGDLSRESGECNKHHEWIHTHYMHRNCCLKKTKLQVHMHRGSDPAHTLYTAFASCVYVNAWHCCEVHWIWNSCWSFSPNHLPASPTAFFLSSSQLFWQPNNCVVSRGRVSPCSTLGYIPQLRKFSLTTCPEAELPTCRCSSLSSASVLETLMLVASRAWRCVLGDSWRRMMIRKGWRDAFSTTLRNLQAEGNKASLGRIQSKQESPPKSTYPKTSQHFFR